MPTLYEDVYKRFRGKITDYDLLKYNFYIRETILENYLISSIVRFKSCDIDLSNRDNNLKQFNNTLTDEVIEILAIGMVYFWLCPKVLNTENLSNNLNTKDFTIYSPANLLSQLQSIKKDLYKDFKREIINYSYDANPISKLKV